jgi:hypothetical protein
MKQLLILILITSLMSAAVPAATSRVITVDLLILGGTIVTMNDRREVINDGAIAIKGDKS